jgi:hypothetical protein
MGQFTISLLEMRMYRDVHDVHDVRVDYGALYEFLENAVGVSQMINTITIQDLDIDIEVAMLEGILGVDEILDGCQTTSFSSRPPNAPRAIKLIRAWVNSSNQEENKSNRETKNVIN